MDNLYVGIDTSKGKHDICIKDMDGKVLGHLRIRDTHSDLKRLYTKLDQMREPRCGCKVVFGMEATSIYYLPLYNALVTDGHAVRLYNPIQSSGYRRLEIRKTKTDPIDAAIIADMLRYSEPPAMRNMDSDIYTLRELSRTRSRIVRKTSDCKRQLKRDIDMLWPGYERFFYKTYGKTSKAVLKKYSVPSRVANTPFDVFVEFLKEHSNSQISRAKAREIHEHAKDTLAIPSLEPVGRTEIRMLLNQIDLLNRQKEQLERKIRKILRQKNTKITTIPGIDEISGAMILGEIGDINRFANTRKLMAYAGLDPSVYQSGRLASSGGRISKRGSPLLRYSLYLAANSARQCDPSFKQYFERKMAEGKHFKTVINATAGKMLRVVYSVLKENKEYRIMTN